MKQQTISKKIDSEKARNWYAKQGNFRLVPVGIFVSNQQKMAYSLDKCNGLDLSDFNCDCVIWFLVDKKHIIDDSFVRKLENQALSLYVNGHTEGFFEIT